MIIKDLITIRQMIDDYKALRPNVGGRGRMDVRSSVNINFQLVDGSEIISLVSHNEFGNLVFIPTNEMQEWTSNDLFMDNDQQDIGLILQRYKK
ncbi:hypothetical protein [Hymenobacter weizhouensis]|uniref:hypothetical protein n=1 Tax=Hymenobacter sp. YIM 151500-1 TaxID=2987689 RepID=UPI002225F901|nr:hypothetical protein [Hymenobacter sp. YIM 151500-1]UYZ61950.1 hypothetical protein OIS53_13170 [Hymenobacter sp. YIM 151500-1]